ncbi:MAG: CBS domain-containing protein [Gemmatimonadota bacterium]|nr:CBS domain-containing protein [Gemmatimonadota bacterium]
MARDRERDESNMRGGQDSTDQSAHVAGAGGTTGGAAGGSAGDPPAASGRGDDAAWVGVQGRSSFYSRAELRRSQRGVGQGTGRPGASGVSQSREANRPTDLRAGGGQRAGGYAEIGRDAENYDPGTRGGARDVDAENYGVGRVEGAERDYSGELRMGYRDFGAGREAPHDRHRDTQRRTRWHREPSVARDIMTKNPKCVTREGGLQDIARIMREEDTGVVPVIETDGRLLGLVTDRDIVLRSLSEGKNPLELTATDVMTDDVEAVTPDESLREVVDLMGEKQIRRVPVVDSNDRLVGIISMGDVANRADYDEDLQEALEEISARRSFWTRLFA